jgi:hypothetical protein
VLALAGCAEPSGGSGASGAASATSAPSQAPTTKPPEAPNPPTTTTPAPTGAPATAPPVAGDTVTVRGTVRKGVERGCLLVDATDGKAWLLIGQARPSLRAGARVRVVGQRVETFANTCGEDAALAVVSVTTQR